MRAIVVYALLRTALFLAPFLLLVGLGMTWWIALVAGVLFAFAASAVFLVRQRAAAVEAIGRMREGRGASADDEDAEDALDDASGTDAAETADANETVTAHEVAAPEATARSTGSTALADDR